MTADRRLLRLITRLNIGGPARQALLLTRDIGPGYRTVLAAGTPPAHEGELSDPEVLVHRVPLVRPLRPVPDAAALRAVRELMCRHRIQLVHSHMAKAGIVARTAALSAFPRPRTVHTFHGHVLEGYFRPLPQQGFIALERRLARRTDALVAVSTEVRDRLLELGIGRPEQYRVIPLGFDLSAHLGVRGPSGILRARLGLPADVPLLGVLGRLTLIKDHATLFAALALVPGAHLAVLGDGELRTQLERHAATLGVSDRVHFTGWWNDVPAAMSDMDLVVLTSRNEGTPVSLIEAQACGKTIVSTDVGGVRTVIEDGVSGLLAPAGNAEQLANRMRLALDSPELRGRLGSSGRRSASERFSKERLLTDIRDLYDELLDHGTGRQR